MNIRKGGDTESIYHPTDFLCDEPDVVGQDEEEDLQGEALRGNGMDAAGKRWWSMLPTVSTTLLPRIARYCR